MFRIRLLAAVVGMALPMLAVPAASANLGPEPVTCNVFAPVPNCYIAAVSGTDTFTVSTHFLRPGQILTGTYSWEIGGQGGGEFPSFGAVAVSDHGEGLKLLGCHGKLHDSNAKATYGTPRAFMVTKGHTVCRWRATATTLGWAVNGLGLGVSAGGESFLASDFYAITNHTMLDGTIRFRNDRQSPPVTLGVPGAAAHITGPGGSHKATTNANGDWYAVVAKGGSYSVRPIIPRKQQVGKNYVSPKIAHVHVPNGGHASADFLVDDPLKVTLAFDKTSVPAAGAAVSATGVSPEIVNATVTVTDAGAPDPSFQVAIRPFQGATHSLANLPVLAKICGAVGTWPSLSAADVNTTIDATTDSNGQVKFPIQIGTIPGNLVIEVRPTDQSSTALQNVDLTLVDPIGTIHVTPLGGGQNLVGGIGADIRANGYLMGGTSSWALQMARMAANGTLGAYNVAPVSYPGQLGIDAMLVYPAGTRLAVSSATNVLLNPPPNSFIVQPSRWVSSGAATGLTFDQAARQNFIAGYPTLAQWLAGASVPEGANGSWNLGPATTGSPTSFDSFGQWFGFGYDVPGTC